MNQNILAIQPHPDDELSKAGSLAQHVELGDKITLVCATSGQMGRRMGKPIFANRESLWLIRETELRTSCKSIGIDDIRFWRMQDKTVQFRDPERLADRIYDLIRDISPSIIYTFYPEHGVHPDHNAIAAATALAISRIELDERPLLYGTCMTANCRQILGTPDLEIDVSDVIDKKMAAVHAHRSQSELDTKKLDDELENHPDRRDEILAPYRTELFWVYQETASVAQLSKVTRPA